MRQGELGLPGLKKLARIDILQNTQISERHTVSQMDERGTFKLGDPDRTGFLWEAKGKGNLLLDKTVEVMSPVVNEEPATVVSAEWAEPEAMGPSGHVHVDGGKTGVLSQKATKQD